MELRGSPVDDPENAEVGDGTAATSLWILCVSKRFVQLSAYIYVEIGGTYIIGLTSNDHAVVVRSKPSEPCTITDILWLVVEGV